MQPDHAPTPFTADEIRAACPEGHTLTYRMEPADGPTFLQVMRFSGCDAEGADVTTTMRSEEGEPKGAFPKRRSKWRDLQAHASFPAAQARIVETRIRVPPGTFEVWVYTIEQGDDVTRFFFAKDLPGPPIQMIRMQDGAEVMRMTLMARE